MPALPPLPVARFGVATLAEYEAAGWSRWARRVAVAQGRLVRVAPGRLAPTPSHLDTFRQADLALTRRAVAAAIRREEVGLSHLAAAHAQGCPVWAPSPRSCVTTWDAELEHVTGLHLHHVPNSGSIVSLDGVPMTTLERTIADIACEFGTESALVTGDFALRAGWLDPVALRAAIADCRGHTGVDRARIVPELLDPLAESPLESRGRWHIYRHGLPLPHSQVVIRTLGGRFLGRVDHYWTEGVVGEADGRIKYVDNPEALPLEKGRQQLLEDVDLEVVRFAARDLRDFRDAAGRIERARTRRRRLVAQGEPPRWVAFTRAGVRLPVGPHH